MICYQGIDTVLGATVSQRWRPKKRIFRITPKIGYDSADLNRSTVIILVKALLAPFLVQGIPSQTSYGQSESATHS